MKDLAHCKSHDKFTAGCGNCRMARLVQMDGEETVFPSGVPTRVPRDKCRCPILKVGDFCPVHGG